MRAAVMQGLHQPLKLETLPDPTPGEGDVIVRVGRCGICGSDLHMTEDASFGMGAGVVLGHEFAGEVVALGRGVEGLATGDLVAVSPLKSCGRCASCRLGEVQWCERFGLQGGGYAEYCAAPRMQCLPIPKGLSALEAASLPETFFTVWSNVFDRARLSGSEILLVQGGTSGIGVTAIQLATALGHRTFDTADSASPSAVVRPLTSFGLRASSSYASH